MVDKHDLWESIFNVLVETNGTLSLAWTADVVADELLAQGYIVGHEKGTRLDTD